MKVYTRAPDFDHAGLEWFNVEHPLHLKDLRGRFVILDFWTFCCINCLHTLSSLNLIAKHFANDVVVIGVHSPKFTTEQDSSRLTDAIRRHHIHHPIIHDPKFVLWDQYAIRSWPTLVIITPDGQIADYLVGEPDTEKLTALLEKMVADSRRGGMPKPPPIPSKLISYPETPLLFPGKIKVAPDFNGIKYWAVADSGHHRIVVFDDQGVPINSYGKRTAGFADGEAHDALFNSPQGLIVTHDSIFVADTGNHAIRHIDRVSGLVSTLAGNGTRGGPLIQAEVPGAVTALASPWDLEYDDDTLYFANAGTHQVGTIITNSGMLSLLAGTGTESLHDGPAYDAALAQPSGLALYPDHKVLFIADSETSSIRALFLSQTPHQQGILKTIIGHGLFTFGYQDGALDSALLQHPLGVAVADAQTLYIVDSYNDCLRRISLKTNTIETIDFPSFSMREPAGVVCDGPDRLLICDTGMHRILEWTRPLNTWKIWFG